MSFTVDFQEDYKSREINITDNSFEQRIRFLICGDFLDNAVDQPPYGKNDDVIALQAAYSILPAFFIMPKYDGGFTPLVISSINLSMVDHDKWDVEVTYKQPEYGEGSGGSNVNTAEYGPQVQDATIDGEPETEKYVQLAINISSVGVQTLQSLSLLNQETHPDAPTAAVYTVGKSAPIGQTREEVLGTEKYAREFSFTVTDYKEPTKMSFLNARKLYRLITTLNDRPFFKFPPGSVLFLEAEGQGDIASSVPFNYTFQVRPNFKLSPTENSSIMDPTEEDPLLQFDTINDPFFIEATWNNLVWKDKDGSLLVPEVAGSRFSNIFAGWDVVDYRYGEGEVDSWGFVVQIPIMRLVHNIYNYSNFNNLAIGAASGS